MAFLGWLFVGWLFRRLLPFDQIDTHIAGLIILAAAPCTAMVFVWSNLTKGEPHFTLSQVALNDAIMMVAFAPIVWTTAWPGNPRAVWHPDDLRRPPQAAPLLQRHKAIDRWQISGSLE